MPRYGQFVEFVENRMQQLSCTFYTFVLCNTFSGNLEETWIGLTRNGNNDPWKWLDNTTLSWEIWKHNGMKNYLVTQNTESYELQMTTKIHKVHFTMYKVQLNIIDRNLNILHRALLPLCQHWCLDGSMHNMCVLPYFDILRQLRLNGS